MSEQNVSVIKAAYAAFGRGDLPGVLANFDAQIEWALPDGLPFGGTYHGRNEVVGFFEKLPKYFQDLRVEPDEFIAGGDRIIVRGCPPRPG
jgi:ketosteroid isomerase-like protein